MMTFDEWWKIYDGGTDYSNTGIASSAAEAIWDAAQEQMQKRIDDMQECIDALMYGPHGK